MIRSNSQSHLLMEHALIMERAWAPTMINQKIFQDQKVHLMIFSEQCFRENLVHMPSEPFAFASRS